MVWRLLSFCECLYVSFRVLVTPKPQQRTTPQKSVQVFLLLLLVLPFLGGYRFLLSVFFLQSPAHPFFQRHHFHSGGKPRCTKVSELLRLVVEVEDLTVLKCVQIPFFSWSLPLFFCRSYVGISRMGMMNDQFSIYFQEIVLSGDLFAIFGNDFIRLLGGTIIHWMYLPPRMPVAKWRSVDYAKYSNNLVVTVAGWAGNWMNTWWVTSQ